MHKGYLDGEHKTTLPVLCIYKFKSPSVHVLDCTLLCWIFGPELEVSHITDGVGVPVGRAH